MAALTFDRTGRRCRAENDRGIGRCPLLCGCAQFGGGARSLVDYALGVSAALLRSRRDARRRDPVDRRRSTRACRLVCTLCAARIGHAGADRTDAEPRGDGPLSLRAQSYLRCPFAVILGQAALFGDQRLLGYGVLVWLAFHAFVRWSTLPPLVTSSRQHTPDS